MTLFANPSPATWLRRAAHALVAGATALGCLAANAQAWPTRPITMVVPFPAGGPTDAFARAYAQKMSESLGQPVVVDNKAGAGGNIGGAAVAHAAPDGYTLLIGTAALTTSKALYKQLGFDPMKDLTPVATLSTTPVFIWVDARFPAKDFAEMMALVKAKPGFYNYSSSAPATLAHLGSLMLFERAGAKLTHLGYKGSAQAVTDFLGGVFPIYFEVGQPVMGQYKAGKARPLAVLANKRSPLLPDVPSTAELGYPGVEAVPFGVLMAPAGTPAPIVDRLNALSRQVLQQPEIRARLAALYFDVDDGADPATLATWLRTTTSKWEEVIKRSDLKPE